MKIGIFGGTFDPPHLGHLILGAEALFQLRLDRLLWLLTPQPPHKSGQEISDVPTRLAMLTLAIGDEPRFEISRVEIDRPGPHYSVDSLRLLQAQFSQSDLIFLMGGDSLRDLPNWRDPAGILSLCRLGVMRRPGDEIDLAALEARLPGLTRRVDFLDAPLLEISSREIRQRVRENAAYRYYLPANVYEYIQQNRLYCATAR